MHCSLTSYFISDWCSSNWQYHTDLQSWLIWILPWKKKLLMEWIHGCSLKKFTAFITKENFLGYFWLHRLCIGILSFRFLVLNFLYNLSTSFLAYGSFAKVFQLFKSFQMVFSMTIFGEDFFQPFDVQDLKFAIFNFLQ